MTLKPRAEVGDVTNPVPRDIAGFTNGSMLVFGDGARQNYKSRPKLWSSPITQNPALNATEIWVSGLFFTLMAMRLLLLCILILSLLRCM
jgi:hypothetical protein